MKGRAYLLLKNFQKNSSPFLFATLILELGVQQIDRMTPDLDDEEIERTLQATIDMIRESYEFRRQRLAAAVAARRYVPQPNRRGERAETLRLTTLLRMRSIERRSSGPCRQFGFQFVIVLKLILGQHPRTDGLLDGTVSFATMLTVRESTVERQLKNLWERRIQTLLMIEEL